MATGSARSRVSSTGSGQAAARRSADNLIRKLKHKVASLQAEVAFVKRDRHKVASRALLQAGGGAARDGAGALAGGPVEGGGGGAGCVDACACGVLRAEAACFVPAPAHSRPADASLVEVVSAWTPLASTFDERLAADLAAVVAL